MKKRRLEVAVISDVHLGTYDCHADELLAYLNSIQPKILVLNGDIIDIWQFKKSYFSTSHLNVIRKIISMASKGTEVHYIRGNHDQPLQKFQNIAMGNINFCNKLALTLDNKKALFFHGDVFDIAPKKLKWIVGLGDYGYSLLIQINELYNWVLKKRGKEKFSLSNKIKRSKKATKYQHNFENTVTDFAIDNNFDYVVCGHIHKPKKELIETKSGKCLYLNSGDWVENLTALEYSLKRWRLYRYQNDKLSPFFMDEELKEMDMHELIASITAKSEKQKEGESEIFEG